LAANAAVTSDSDNELVNNGIAVVNNSVVVDISIYVPSSSSKIPLPSSRPI
jgi:hypothetical protein